MARAVTVRCERCGADLHPEPGSAQVKCGYCGTTSVMHSQALQAPGSPAAPAPASRVALILGIGLAVAGLAVAAAFLLPKKEYGTAGTGTTASPVVAEATPSQNEPAPSPAAPAEAPEVVRALDGFPPLFTDVDGDKQPELVAQVSISKSGSAMDGFATFDGQTGALRARTSLPEGTSSDLKAVVGKHLLLAQSNGKLSAFDLSSGKEAWSSMLGERIETLCESKSPGEVMTVADTGRHLLVDLTTGRQTPTKEPCARAVARSMSGEDPRDRRDYRAPSGVESYRCGGVRVMGSQNYTVADQCQARARVNSDALDGMVGHALWRAENDWLVFGVRQPGAYIPMVGRLHAGKFAWKAEVPLDNPLEAEEGGPRHVALVGNELVVTSYANDHGQKSFVTAFAQKDGARRFTVPVPAQVKAVSSAEGRLVVQAGSQLILLEPTSGKTLATIGVP